MSKFSLSFFTHRSRLFLFIVGAICVVMTSLPLFRSDFFRPHDYTHASRIVEMYRSLAVGEFPVRWSENFGFGYGMPLFNFYAPLPYYVAMIPYVITQNAILSIKFLFLLNSILAFIGMYLFAAKIWKDDHRVSAAGSISAILFTFATYRALDIYVRGAIGEVMAMVLLPFALYAVLLLRTRPKKGVVLLAVTLASILLSHNLSGMISIGIIGVFGMLLDRSKSHVQSLGLGILGAAGLSSFYVIPSFFEKGFTRIDETITTGYFDYHNHFVALRQFLFGIWGYGGSVPGLGDGISFALGWVPLVLVGLAIIAIALTKLRKPKSDANVALVLSLLLFCGGSLFMATNKSVFVWDHISLLKYMQFPWRFLSFAHVFLAAVAGGCISFLKKNELLRWTACAGVLGISLFLNARYFVPEKYIQDTSEFYSTDPRFIQSVLSKTLNDYLPKAITDEHLPDPSPGRFMVLPTDIAVITKDEPTRVDGHVVCSKQCDVTVNIFQFPGWSATIDGKVTQLEASTFFPTYILSVPSGDHDISVQLRDTPVRKMGNMLSVATIILFVFFYGRSRNNPRVRR